MHHPLKTWEEGVLWVLEKCESTIRLLNEHLNAYFISRSKSRSRREVSWLPYIVVGIWNILPIIVQDAIMNFYFFLQCNCSKSTKWRSSRVIGKKHYKTLYFLDMYFPSAFFNISVHFTTRLIKEIKLFGHVFLHQMYVYERLNGLLKSFIRNRAYLEGSMVQRYCTEEFMQWVLNYADLSNPIGVPKSRYMGRLTGKRNIGKKAITPDATISHCSNGSISTILSLLCGLVATDVLTSVAHCYNPTQ
jgi:hypothetical protein